METALGLICFVLLMAAQIAAVVAVHQSERQVRDQRETSNHRAPVHGLRVPDAA
jgi:hypothetical protein